MRAPPRVVEQGLPLPVVEPEVLVALNKCARSTSLEQLRAEHGRHDGDHSERAQASARRVGQSARDSIRCDDGAAGPGGGHGI